MFSSNNGVSNTIDPAGIFLGRPRSNFNSKMIAFEAYIIAYAKTKNGMTPIGVPSITMRTSNNQCEN